MSTDQKIFISVWILMVVALGAMAIHVSDQTGCEHQTKTPFVDLPKTYIWNQQELRWEEPHCLTENECLWKYGPEEKASWM